MVHGLRGVAFERLGQGITAGGARLANLNLPIPIGLNVESVLSLVDQGGRLAVVFADRVHKQVVELSADETDLEVARSPLVCVASTTVNPTDRDVLLSSAPLPENDCASGWSTSSVGSGSGCSSASVSVVSSSGASVFEPSSPLLARLALQPLRAIRRRSLNTQQLRW